MKPLLFLLLGALCGGIGLALLFLEDDAVEGEGIEVPESSVAAEDRILELPLDSLPGSAVERRRIRGPAGGVPRDGRADDHAAATREAGDGLLAPSPSPPAPTLLDDHDRPYENGERQVAYYDNGQLMYLGSQVLGEDGGLVREGAWEAWHENGTLHELGAYRRDVEHGPWKWWYENGQLQAVGTFDEGVREGKWNYWYEDGHRMMDSEYRGGETCGWWTFYHENGNKRAEGQYINGKFEGRWTVWFESGNLDTDGTGTYVDGKRVGP